MLLLPPLILLPLLLPALFPGCPLSLPPLRLFPRLDLALELPLLLLDGSELSADPVPLRAAGGRLGGVFLVRLGAAHALFLGSLVADFGTAQLADMGLYGAGVDQGADNLLRFLVDAAAVECAINKGCRFPALQGQKLCRVPLDFQLG